MTENGKKFLEFMSGEDQAVKERVSTMEKAELIAFAAEKGFTLTEEDFEQQDAEGELIILLQFLNISGADQMEKKKSLFRQESIDRMQSPEKSDEYIRVSTPKAWILALALSLIAAGVLVWGFTGSIPKTVTVQGVIYQGEYNGKKYDSEVVCLRPVGVAGPFLIGHEASITPANGSSFKGQVVDVLEDPFSYEEIEQLARSNWRLRVLWGDTEETAYQYSLTIDYDDAVKNEMHFADRELVTVTVVLSDVKPITYILN